MPNLLNVIADALGPLMPARWRGDVPVVPVVRFNGVIGAAVPLRPGLSLASTAKMIERAFKVRNARAVALIVNSPGGSPAQSHLVFQRIRQLAAEKNIPVFAFIEDIGASGGYMLACSADEIVADPYSLVGSIGVVGGSFGFEKLIGKLGIERRLYTSGDRKAMLDPFLPEKPELSNKGFKANYTVDKLALGQAPVSTEDPGMPSIDDGSGTSSSSYREVATTSSSASDTASGGGDLQLAIDRLRLTMEEGGSNRGTTAAMANLADAIQSLVAHMRSEQEMIREWADGQGEQNREIKKLLERIARQPEKS